MPEEKINETILEKLHRYFLKAFYALIAIIIAIIAVPTILGVVTYKIIVKEKADISMPEFLYKYLEKYSNG